MAGGRVLGGRYLLSGRPRGSGVAAADQRSGAEVQLDAVPLPETVEPFDQVAQTVEPFDQRTQTVEPFDQVALPAPGPADSATARALTQAAFVAETVPDHPRLSQVFQVFDEAGYLWVAGEAVPGVTLRALLERGGPLSPYRAAELAYDLVMALRAVHAAGLVHGNVTVDTVLVCDDGTALLGGLVVGVAQEALCGGPGADQPGTGAPGGPWTPVRIRARDARAVIVGAVPERWSPEQIGLPPADTPPPDGPLGGPRQAPPVGPEADVWALGVLLHRAVTGEAPFPQQDTEELFAAIRTGRYGNAARPALLPYGASRTSPTRTPQYQTSPYQTPQSRTSQQPPPELPECGPLGPLVAGLLRADPSARPALPEAAERIRQLLVRAPEPIDQDELLSVAALLPVQRRRGEVVEHPEFPHHHHAAPRRHPALLGVALVGGVILFVLLALLVVVSVSR